MTLTNEDITNILDMGSESRTFDKKTGFRIQNGTPETLGLIRDILAFSNTQDGGIIIIGFDDATKQFTGEQGDWWTSFDTTILMDQVNRFCDPRVEIEISIRESFDYKGQKGTLVILETPEFSDIPIICERNGHTSSNEQILRESAVYIRTNAAATEEISNADDMRNLIDRAMLKHGDRLLESFAAIIRGQEPSHVAQLFSNYDQEIDDARSEL